MLFYDTECGNQFNLGIDGEDNNVDLEEMFTECEMDSVDRVDLEGEDFGGETHETKKEIPEGSKQTSENSTKKIL